MNQEKDLSVVSKIETKEMSYPAWQKLNLPLSSKDFNWLIGNTVSIDLTRCAVSVIVENDSNILAYAVYELVQGYSTANSRNIPGEIIDISYLGDDFVNVLALGIRINAGGKKYSNALLNFIIIQNPEYSMLVKSENNDIKLWGDLGFHRNDKKPEWLSRISHNEGFVGPQVYGGVGKTVRVSMSMTRLGMIGEVWLKGSDDPLRFSKLFPLIDSEKDYKDGTYDAIAKLKDRFCNFILACSGEELNIDNLYHCIIHQTLGKAFDSYLITRGLKERY